MTGAAQAAPAGTGPAALVATIGSPEWGGVATMTATVFRYLRDGGTIAPRYIYSLDRRAPGNATLPRLVLGRWRVAEREEVVGGMPGVAIGRRLPALEALQYLGNLPEWLRWARGHQVLQAVGGTSHCGLAFAASGRRFVCWVASPWDEDRMGRYESWPLWRRALDRLQRPALRGIEGYVLRRASVVMALSRYTADVLHDRHGIPWDRLAVVPQPIDTDLFRPAGEGTPPCVLMVGRFTDRRKNTPLLLRAFARLRRPIPEARLVLVGEPPDPCTRAAVEALGLAGSVEFPGTIPHRETPPFFQRASVFAFSSEQEGLGIAALEAMACGLPVVSTRCGGPEEFVRDGVNGFLVDRGGEEQMAERLRRLLQDRALRDRLGRRARQDVEERYSEERVLSLFRAIYRRVWPELASS